VTDSSWTSVSPSTSLQSTINYQLSTNDGSKTVYLHLRDSAGATATASATITLDATAPTGTLKLDSGAKLTVDATVSATITGSDTIGVTGYWISSSSTTPGINDTGWTAVTSTTSLSTTPDKTLTDLTGLSTQYLWLKDAAGNVSATISDGIEVVRVYANRHSQNDGQYTSIVVDSNNQPWISSYWVTSSGLLWNTFADGGLSDDVADNPSSTDVGAGTSIAADSNNKLHIAYRDTTNSRLKYATNASGSWVTETVTVSGVQEAGGISPSIGIDSNGKVHMSHVASSQVRYATNSSGSWVTAIVSSAATFVETSLAVDSGNAIHIAAKSISPARLYYLTNLSGSWQGVVVDSRSLAGAGPSIVLTTSGSIYISYWQNGTVQLATNIGSGWSLQQIDSVSGQPSAIGVDSAGLLHVVYFDASNDDLIYATNYSGTWTTTTLDSSGDVGDFCDLAIDTNDRLHISYYDATNGDLKYITTAD
jgi:hypothetical protein